MRHGRLLFVTIAAVAALSARADVQRLACDGSVYRVDVAPFVGGAKPNGTILKTTRQRARGGKDSFIVTGTDDAILDTDPALEIDLTGHPIIVWSRAEGGGLNLFISRFDEAWSAPRMLVRLDGDEHEPQVHFDDEYLHVSWRQEQGNTSSYWHAAFDPATYQIIYGPERLSTDLSSPVPIEGGPETATVSANDSYFCSSTLGKPMADPNRAYIWGVRDEPVPVGYQRTFLLPAEIRTIFSQSAGFVGGRLTLWITTNDRLYYTTLSNGHWADMRIIEITPQTSASDARLLIEEINTRLSESGH